MLAKDCSTFTVATASGAFTLLQNVQSWVCAAVLPVADSHCHHVTEDARPHLSWVVYFR